MSQAPQRIDLHLPTRTILKVLVAALLVWAVLRLWPEVIFLSISLLLAVALDPVVAWMSRRGVSRGVSVMILAVLLVALVGVFVAFVLPPLVKQVADLVANFPAFRDRVEQHLPHDDAVLREIVDQIFLRMTLAD